VGGIVGVLVSRGFVFPPHVLPAVKGTSKRDQGHGECYVHLTRLQHEEAACKLGQRLAKQPEPGMGLGKGGDRDRPRVNTPRAPHTAQEP
jgi:hypothetical protein